MSYCVPSPKKRPDYVFYDTPTVDQMRARAVLALQDFLSIQWRTHQKIAHNKKGAVSRKRFIYEAENLYAGLPYTDAGMGLFQFLEYYDEESGRLRFYGDGQDFNHKIGGTCACGVCWSLATVCSSVSGCFINFYMTPKNGYFPVGDFKIPEDLDDYRNYHTSRIIEEAGIDTILEAYAQVLPADAVTSSDRDHTMMVIEAPTVVRDKNGRIDPEKSTVVIADQQGGKGDGFYDVRCEDDIIHYSGRIRFSYTFAALLKMRYIPVTPAEFLGKKPYERARVTLDGAADSIDELLKLTVSTNYPMAVIKVLLERGNGHVTPAAFYHFNRRDPHSGLARAFPLARFAEELKGVEGKSLTVEVTCSNGEILRPVTFAL